jgi:pantoate--beta-alanine ligase
MEFLTRSASIRDRIRTWRAAGARVALVPTSGTLHKGHMSLVAEAQERAGHVVVSIFPDPEEREAPTLAADRELLQKVGASVVFAPPLQEIYPIGRDSAATVNNSQAATLLVKLFNLMQPDIAVFGERDIQQLVMVRRLVDDLFLPIDIVACPTWRDSDGLAVATANRHLTVEERALAPRLYAILSELAAKIDAGDRNYATLQRQGADSLAAAGFTVDHVEIRQEADLAEVRQGERDLVILGSVRLNAHRLTDNLRVRVIDRY